MGYMQDKLSELLVLPDDGIVVTVNGGIASIFAKDGSLADRVLVIDFDEDESLTASEVCDEQIAGLHIDEQLTQRFPVCLD